MSSPTGDANETSTSPNGDAKKTQNKINTGVTSENEYSPSNSESAEIENSLSQEEVDLATEERRRQTEKGGESLREFRRCFLTSE